jgi:transposase
MNPTKYDLIAIDIAKRTLRVQTSKSGFDLPYNATGLDRLKHELSSWERPLVVCEASGGYERKLVHHLHAWEVAVSVVNPALVRSFVKSEGLKAKNDPIDAKMLMKFAEQKKLRPTPAPSPIHEQMAALLDRRAQLSGNLTREKNRLEKEPEYTRDFIEQSIAFIEGQIAEVDRRITELNQQDPEHHQDCQRLVQIKGVGELTANTVLTYLPEIRTVSRNQLVALAGLAPYDNDSGDKQGRRYIQGGRAKIRRCLFNAARSAARHNPHIRDYVAGLTARGKPYRSAIVAAMRKILICMQSMLKNPHFALA